MTSSLRHNDVVTVENLYFYEILPIKSEKFRDVSDFEKRQINATNWKESFIFNTKNSILKNLSCTLHISPVKA